MFLKVYVNMTCILPDLGSTILSVCLAAFGDMSKSQCADLIPGRSN